MSAQQISHLSHPVPYSITKLLHPEYAPRCVIYGRSSLSTSVFFPPSTESLQSKNQKNCQRVPPLGGHVDGVLSPLLQSTGAGFVLSATVSIILSCCCHAATPGRSLLFPSVRCHPVLGLGVSQTLANSASRPRLQAFSSAAARRINPLIAPALCLVTDFFLMAGLFCCIHSGDYTRKSSARSDLFSLSTARLTVIFW